MANRWIALIVWVLLQCLYSNDANSKTIKVDKQSQFNSLKNAIEIAEPHDSILLFPGNYFESSIIIEKPLTIIGINYPVIDGEFKGEIFTIHSDSVTLDGLFIKNVGVSYIEDYAAVRLVKCSNFLIQNLVLENLFFGIYLEKSKNGKLYHNKVIGEAKEEHNSGNGIHLWYSKNIIIDMNYLAGVRDGIYLEFSDYCTITNNESTDNLRYGLHFMFSNHDTYTNNTFYKNGAGVAVMFSKDIQMTNNVFKENWGTASYGLLLKEINDAVIKDNTFNTNTIGINVEGSNRIEYSNNEFTNNGWAIKVRGACYTNQFYKNAFVNNSFDVSYNSKVNDNVFNNNYWSRYSGYDLDKDGIGDVPYRPVNLFSYIVNQTPEAIVLLRSLFIDIIDFSEKVSPVFTPDNLLDNNPLMKMNND